MQTINKFSKKSILGLIFLAGTVMSSNVYADTESVESVAKADVGDTAMERAKHGHAYYCVYLPTKPNKRLEFKIKHRGSWCMVNPPSSDVYDWITIDDWMDSNRTISTDQAGVVCADDRELIHVEDRLACSTQAAYSHISYDSVDGAGYSSSSKIRWREPWFDRNHVVLDYEQGKSAINVCPSKTMCESKTQITSGGKNDLYFIYKPY